MRTETKQILARVIELQRELDIRKDLYTELDMLAMQLQDEGFKDAVLEGMVVTLVDNFLDVNTVFRPAGVKRFELKVKKVKV